MLSEHKIERLLKIADKHRFDSDYKYKLVAIVFNKNKILSIGVNTNTKSYPWLKKYFVHGTLHAEIAALIPIFYNDNNDNLNMFVYRRSIFDNSLRNAKPCAMCVQTLYDTGWFRKIFWTTDNQTIECARISELYNNVMLINKDLRYLLNGKKLKI